MLYSWRRGIWFTILMYSFPLYISVEYHTTEIRRVQKRCLGKKNDKNRVYCLWGTWVIVCHLSALQIHTCLTDLIVYYPFNTLHTELFRKRKDICLYVMSFCNIEMAQVVEILPSSSTRICLSIVINAMAADDLATKGARLSAAMALT